MNYASKKIIVGSRESPLAKEQVEIFLKVLERKLGNSYLNFVEKKFVRTSGDKFLDKKISIVFGCGGDRDKYKRSIMGKIANQYCDKIFLTDDNPRYENPKKIRNQIKKKINRSK